MEEDFKKLREDVGGVDEIVMDGEIQGLEGVGREMDAPFDVGASVLEARVADAAGLEGVSEVGLMAEASSLGTVVGEVEGVVEMNGLEGLARAKEGFLDCRELPTGEKEGALGVNGGSGKEVIVLNWKKAVIGGGVNVEEGCRFSDCGGNGGEAAGDGSNAGKVRGGEVKGGSGQWADKEYWGGGGR